MTRRATPPLEARLGTRVDDYQRVDCASCGTELARILNPDDAWGRSIVLPPGWAWNAPMDCYALTADARARVAAGHAARFRRGNLLTATGRQDVGRSPHTLPIRIQCARSGCGRRQWLRAETLDVNGWQRATGIDEQEVPR